MLREQSFDQIGIDGSRRDFPQEINLYGRIGHIATLGDSQDSPDRVLEDVPTPDLLGDARPVIETIPQPCSTRSFGDRNCMVDNL